MRALAVLAGVAIVSGCSAPGFGVASADPNSPEVVRLFEQYDCDRNGLLTYEELKAAEVAVRKPGGEIDSFAKFIQPAVEVNDSDGNGGLDKPEAARIWRNMQGVLVHARTDGGCK